MMLDLAEEGRYILRTDPHCHILPGVDDGSQSDKTSLAMAQKAARLGIRRSVATPHACHPATRCDLTADEVRHRVERLNELFAQHEIALTVLPGMEFLLSEELPQKFEGGQLLSWADQGKYILLELGFNSYPPHMWEVLDYFDAKGLTAIVAHPERYVWLPASMEALFKLIERGYFFQINVMSINGLWGAGAQMLALEIMHHTPHWIVGTDSHNDSEKFWGIEKARQVLQKFGVWRGQGQPHPAPLATPNLMSEAG